MLNSDEDDFAEDERRRKKWLFLAKINQNHLFNEKRWWLSWWKEGYNNQSGDEDGDSDRTTYEGEFRLFRAGHRGLKWSWWRFKRNLLSSASEMTECRNEEEEEMTRRTDGQKEWNELRRDDDEYDISDSSWLRSIIIIAIISVIWLHVYMLRRCHLTAMVYGDEMASPPPTFGLELSSLRRPSISLMTTTIFDGKTISPLLITSRSWMVIMMMITMAGIDGKKYQMQQTENDYDGEEEMMMFLLLPFSPNWRMILLLLTRMKRMEDELTE